MSNTAIPKISTIQEEIIAEFETLKGDREGMLTYLMELGEKLPPMEEHYKTEHNIVKGCLSKVWLTYERQGDRLFFQADSNTAITKGLISLLLRVLSGQKIDDIVNANLQCVKRIGLMQLIGSQRAGGFANMVKAIKLIAIGQQGTQK
ncbi:MAG: SufE family protein [Bacteroidota bacterium]